MSSKKATYESSMLCFFGADDEFAGSGFTTVGPVGPLTIAALVSDDFGFPFGTAVSLLTLTDAGT